MQYQAPELADNVLVSVYVAVVATGFEPSALRDHATDEAMGELHVRTVWLPSNADWLGEADRPPLTNRPHAELHVGPFQPMLQAHV